jgi:hypothetical protein
MIHLWDTTQYTAFQLFELRHDTDPDRRVVVKISAGDVGGDHHQAHENY